MSAPPQATTHLALMTSGGLAPCLSSSVASLVSAYLRAGAPFTLRLFHHSYMGILRGESTLVNPKTFNVAAYHAVGGSPMGSSRVKLTNAADCKRRNLVPELGDPLEVAALQLKAEGVSVLHTSPPIRKPPS